MPESKVSILVPKILLVAVSMVSISAALVMSKTPTKATNMVANEPEGLVVNKLFHIILKKRLKWRRKFEDRI